MEEWCAVCAEPLEWVAYGPCGHREVCFTCTARLRFVLEDKRCCICKQDCPCVFVTKALGDYTKVLTDFSVLQEQQQLNRSSEEKTQSKYWYESNVQAFFDDEEPFRIIEAMCRLYCSACEGIISAGESLPKGGVKKGHIFKSLELLRSHLFAAHKLIMCELCLKGRKVFICEQKLYTRTQLEQHLLKGDSKVDGTQEERAGFTGHPMCEFCRKRFYGENELYAHMSTEHYTCHFCQRSRPGHFEYYRNYDDLEMHFRNDHELCEHPDCLAKKFVVFANQADLKHHNATTHGGNMSRSQRNAALQIPVSFQYRRPGQDSRDDVGDRGPAYRRGGRDRGSFPSNVRVVADSLDAAVQGSVESALFESAIRESAAMSASIESTAVGSSGGGEALEAANSLSVSDTQGEGGEGGIVVSRYASAVSGSGPSSLVNSAFPPLPGLSQNVLPRAKLRNQAPASMAALLGGGGGRGGIQVLNLAASRPSTAKADQGVWGSNNTGSTERGSMVQGTSTQAKGKLQGVGAWASSNGGSIHHGTLVGGARSEEEEPLQGVSAVSGSGPPPGAYRSAPGGVISSSASGRVISPSRTADERDGADSEVELSMEELRAANKALIKRIHAGLKDNEKQFADFKDVSDQFRKGAMSAKDYTGHITRLGLLHIVPELARLCPDPVKRKELLEVHRTTLALNNAFPPGLSSTASSLQRGKGAVERGHSKVLEGEAAVRLSTSSPTQVPGQLTTEDVEVLSRDGYRSSKGKSKVEESSLSTHGTGKWVVEDGQSKASLLPQVLVKANQSSLGASSNSLPGWTCAHCTLFNQKGSLECAACGSMGPATATITKSGKGAGSTADDKRKQKISKFQRMRLGDGSVAARLDSATMIPKGGPAENGSGAWKNGGGQRLVSLVQTEAVSGAPVTDAAWDHKKGCGK